MKKRKAVLPSPPFQRGRLRGGCRFTLIAAVSLDGRITRGNNEGSPPVPNESRHIRAGEWTSREDKKWFRRELDRYDAVIMGRKTLDAVPRPLTPRNRIVFTRSPNLPSFPRRGMRGGSLLTFRSGTTRQLNNLLRQHHWHRTAVLGGTQIYDWFLKRNLISEMYLTLEPVIFGSGKPFSSQFLNPPRRFRLLSSKRLNSQATLLLHYKRL